MFHILVLLAALTLSQGVLFPVPWYFYPMGPDAGDIVAPVNDDRSTGPVPISTSFPFFGTSHTSLIVNTNGAISFIDTLWRYIVQEFPNGKVLIAPYWADVDTWNGYGRVYYRQTTDSVILARATADVKEAFCTQMDFQASWVFVATWYRVASYGAVMPYPLDTFQAVLITDGVKSFTMFNYGDINWTYGTASSGIPAQAGYTADNEHYFNIPGSRTAAIQDIATTTNCRLPGRWFFRIDSDRPCCCGGFGDAVVDTYDHSQLIVSLPVKHIYSRWDQNPDDPCKFQVRAVMKDDIGWVATDAHFDWVGFAIAVHSSNNEKEGANIMFAQDTAGVAVIGIRGQGYQGVELLPFIGNTAVVTINGMSWVVEKHNDHLVTMEPDSCDYSFSWMPDGISTKWELWVGKKYKDNTMEGMCGDCDGDAIDDWRLCPSGPTVPIIESSIPSIDTSCQEGKNTGEAFAGGMRLDGVD